MLAALPFTVALTVPGVVEARLVGWHNPGRGVA